MHDRQFVTIEIGSGNELAPASLAEFPPEALERFSDLLKCEIKSDSALDLLLRTVALSYRSQKNETDKTARAAKRGRQRKAAKTAQKALDAINQLKLEDVVPFVIKGGDQAYDKFRALTRLLEHFSPVMDEVAKRKLRPAREENDLLTHTCGALRLIYEESSGLNASHNTMFEAVDAGEPLSPFGRFVVVFFEYVDPSISAGGLRESLARAVWPSRK